MIGAQPMMPGAPPTGMMQPAQPPMIPNPAFAQWAQQAQAWIAEKQRRQQEFQSACELIQGDAVKRYKIDIEADSTVAADEQAEKQARVEFLTAMTPFLGAVIPMAQANPILAPLVKELVLFAVRGYKVSRPVEDAFETALDALGKGPPQPTDGKHGNTKSPEEIKVEAETAKMKAQVEALDIQQDGKSAELKAQADQQKTAVAMAKVQSDQLLAQAKLAQDDAHHRDEQDFAARQMQGREALDQAKVNRIASKAADGLV